MEISKSKALDKPTKNILSCLEEAAAERDRYKETSGGLGDAEEVGNPFMSWPHENGQLEGDEGNPVGCLSSQSSLNFSANAPPYFLRNRNYQPSRRPFEMLILGFLWSEAGLPNL